MHPRFAARQLVSPMTEVFRHSLHGAALLVATLLSLGATPAQALPLVITTASLSDGTAGVPYSGLVEAASGTTPYIWTLDAGSLPAGVLLDGGTGGLSGTATLAGTSNFIVRATDALGDTATRALSITILSAAASALSFEVQPTNVTAGASIAPTLQVKVVDAFTNAVEGASVSLALVGTGVLTGGGAVLSDASGLATFSALSVDLAGSKQLTASSGALTPLTSSAFTVSAAAAAALSYEVQPTNVTAGASIAPTVQVKVVDAFTNAVEGASVSLALVGTGVLTGGGAVLSDASGLATFSALSVDLAGSKQLTASSGALTPLTSSAFTVSCPVITLAPATLPSGENAVAYSQTVSVSGGQAPYTFAVSVGTLPPGLSLDTGGLLSGTPGTPGTFAFTVTATDANLCEGSREYSLTICGVVSVLPASLPEAPLSAAYSQTLSGSGGTAPYTFAITAGTLPAGLALSGAGLLSGTPSETGVFAFTVTATAVGGCVGSTPFTLSVVGTPAAASDLAVTRTTSGNDADGTIRLQITFTPTAFTATSEVYRAPFGSYPRYDDAGGLEPPTPSYPPGAPWVLTAVMASGQMDEPATRDTWSYVVFFKNSFGQPSPVSNQPAGTPNYALGDVSDGFVAGTGDNLVSDLDVSLLGAHYGISGAAITTAGVSYLDVGPTLDFAMTSRPFTDESLDFEDLIVIATNYGAVSSPALIAAAADATARAAKGPERVMVKAPSLVELGELFTAVVRIEAAGRMQGLSALLAWDASVAEIVGSSSPGWVESQKGVVWSGHAGTIDAALLGVRGAGLTGSGDLATVTFRARRTGDPAVRLARVFARDAANRPLGESALSFATQAGIPARTLLLAPWPNPMRGDATVSFALAHGGEVDLSIYSVDGRRVRTLARGPFDAGSYRFTWTGDGHDHRPVAPGIYYAQLVAGGRRYSHKLVHLK